MYVQINLYCLSHLSLGRFNFLTGQGIYAECLPCQFIIHPVGNFEGSLNRIRQGFVDICIPTNALVNHYRRVSMDSNINLEELLSVFCTFAVCW